MDKQKSLEVLKLRVVQTEEIKREKLMSLYFIYFIYLLKNEYL